MNTSEPAILSNFLYDLYIVLSEQEGQNKSFYFRFYYSPLVNFIWIGLSFMALGGVLSFSDRKNKKNIKWRSNK